MKKNDSSKVDYKGKLEAAEQEITKLRELLAEKSELLEKSIPAMEKAKENLLSLKETVKEQNKTIAEYEDLIKLLSTEKVQLIEDLERCASSMKIIVDERQEMVETLEKVVGITAAILTPVTSPVQ